MEASAQRDMTCGLRGLWDEMALGSVWRIELVRSPHPRGDLKAAAPWYSTRL